MRASAIARFQAHTNDSALLGLTGRSVSAAPHVQKVSASDDQVSPMVATLSSAGVPYGVFDAATGELWWGDHAHGLLSRGEQRALEMYLPTVAQRSGADHACVLGGRLEPAGVPRLRLAISAHPELPTRTVVVLSPRPAASHLPALDRLSGRERAVADLIAHGKSNKCIAVQLSISEHTVRRHTEHLFTKLGVRTRAAVAALVVANTV